MTGATTGGPPAGKASPLIWVGLLLAAAAVVLLAFTTRDDPNIGTPGDPNGVGEFGLLGFRLFVEESGGDTQRNVGLPGEDIDVAVMAIPRFGPPFGAEDGVNALETWEPLLDWVRDGGTLLTSLDVDGGPTGGLSFVEEDELVPRGQCSLEELAATQEVRPLEHNPVVPGPRDQSCFGNSTEAVIVVREVGQGRIIRVASMNLFANRALDDADNAAVLARLIRINAEPTVGFLPQPPTWFEAEQLDGEDAPAELRLDDVGNPIPYGGAGNPFGFDGPVDSDGNPIGQGDEGLFGLLPTSVLALLAGLGVSALLYALAKGRRLGSPVIEPKPIELPSSSYVDAVGRLYRNTADAEERSAAILRHDLRTDLARRVGMSPDSSAEQLATALASGDQRNAIIAMLDGPAPRNDDEFVALATELIETRDRIERGGVSTLARSEDISIVTERTFR